MRTVADMLANKTKPNNIIAPNALVVDALHLMKQVNLSYVIVMDGDVLKGIFSERNYSRNVALEGKSSATCPVKEAMTKALVKITPEHTVEECIQLILDNKCRYLPVEENGQLLGVITIHDILREALRSKEALFDSSLTDRLIEEGSVY
jgi:signal-transduction protein with cAMP-binding, CBS, and nucleotidyltransferase domain